MENDNPRYVNPRFQVLTDDHVWCDTHYIEVAAAVFANRFQHQGKPGHGGYLRIVEWKMSGSQGAWQVVAQ